MGQRETVLDISGLHSSYGMIKAIKDINIHVDKGELVSLLGANGAGKSTLLKSIIGMVHIESGSVKYQGEELVGRKSHEIIPMGISIVPEGRKIFADATVMENLAIGSYTGQRTRHWTRGSWTRYLNSSHALRRGRARWGARCPEANSRCWPSEGP